MGAMITGPAAVPAEWVTLLRQSAKPRTGLHVTSHLGCPRRDALLREGAVPDLARLEARLSGTLLHAGLSSVNPDTAEVSVAFDLFGNEVEGSIDRLERDSDQLFTADYKSSDSAKMPEAPYPDQVWQQESYRYGLEYMGEEETHGWRIYFRRAGKWGRYEHIGPVWTEEALAGFRPHGGAFTTAEIAGQCASKLAAKELPLVGATQRIGAGTSCSYCEVEVPCGQAGSEIEL